MILVTTEGDVTGVTPEQLASVLAYGLPFVLLRDEATALAAYRNASDRFVLLHWSRNQWQRSRVGEDEGGLSRRMTAFLNRSDAWSAGVAWDVIEKREASSVPVGLHVLLTYALIFGGFAGGVVLGVWAGWQFEHYGNVLVYVFAAVAAPPLALLGRSLSLRIPPACRACGGTAVPIHAGRFTYLCPHCGEVHVSMWGMHKAPPLP